VTTLCVVTGFSTLCVAGLPRSVTGMGSETTQSVVISVPTPSVGTRRGRWIMFLDRADAGRRLAAKLTRLAGRDDVIVLALPRGGVPVGFEVARSLGVPLDVFLVRKLGTPGREELAMGRSPPAGCGC